MRIFVMLTLYTFISFFIINHYTCKEVDFPVPTSEKFVRNRETPSSPTEIQYAFIYEDCKHLGNSSPVAMKDLILVNKYGLRITWNKSLDKKYPLDKNQPDESYKGFDDIQGIFDCTITVKLGPHDKMIDYQELILGIIYWVEFDHNEDFAANRSIEIAKLNPENTIANKGLKELKAACKDAKYSKRGIPCENLGCVVITYGNKTLATCNVYDPSENMGDEREWFTRDDVQIRILLVGSFIGKGADNGNVPISYPPFNTKIMLDFTRLYAGPCENIQQFYCPTHGVCIKYPLACDNINMRNCPMYESLKFDDSDACKSTDKNIPPALNKEDPGAKQNLITFWALLAVFSAFILFVILNYCFWRPGYLIWRLGRLRNCFNFGNCCFKYCQSCSKGDCAQCCKTSGKFDTTEPVATTWSKLAMGDGFHMRENR